MIDTPRVQASRRPPPRPTRPPVAPQGRTDGSALSHRLLAGDFEDLAALYPSMETSFAQLERGPLRLEVEYLRLPGVELRRGGADRAMHARGEPRTATVKLLLCDRRSAGWTWRGARMSAGEVLIGGRDQELHWVAPAGSVGIGLWIEPGALEDAARVLLRRELAEVLSGPTRLRPAPAAFRAFRDGLVRALREARTVDEDPALTRRRARDLRARLLGLACGLLLGDRDGDGDGLPGHRYGLVRRAEELWGAAPQEMPPTVLDLCHELRASRRTLFYAFQDVYGTSPMAYFAARRLQQVRGALLAAAPGTTTVGAVAASLGYGRSDKMAASYLRQFGERPSETLRRMR